MGGKDLIADVFAGREPARPPYVPLLGRVAHVLGQVDATAFVTDPQVQAVALAETAGALGADVVTVGMGTDPAVGVQVVERLRPLLAGRGVAACLAEPDVAGVRAYCDAGVDMVVLVEPDRSAASRFKTIANACGFYQAGAVLADPSLEDGARVAADLGLHGAIVAHPRGDEPGVVGGGLDASHLGGAPPVCPRPAGFFWSFASEVDPGASPEALAALGTVLTG
ncbi:MAG: hypothetical protein M5U14_10130 [Acidimicrobiia bacterium]|nr:hypothetical protein [Acidimicrobiia bacterium]